MKTTLQKLSVLILLTAIVASCSVQKRRYNKGWHIDWTSSHSKTNKKDGEAPAIKAYHTTAPAAEEKNTQVITALADKNSQEALQQATATENKKQAAAHASVTHATTHTVKPEIAIAKNKLKTLDTTHKIKGNGNDNTDTLAILSFVFGILGFVTGILAIPAIVLGNKALRRYKAGSGDDGNRIFALLGVVFGWVVIALIILYLLIIVLLLSVLL